LNNAADRQAETRLLLIEQARRNATRNFLAFMEWCWWMPKPLLIGRHTRTIANRLTRAVEDFKLGKSTYLMIDVPFRHGKSDMVSRAFPAYFLGACSELMPDVVVSGYSDTLAYSFTKRTKQIIESAPYRALWRNIRLSGTNNSVKEWQLANNAGIVTVAGLLGTLTGKGGALVIIDDYCKNAEEANSETYRNKTWDAFAQNLITRASDPAIVIVCATRWHTDDLGGRIIKAMKEDIDFPRFERMSFPATKPGEYDYLFPERFTPAWYKSRRSVLGSRAAAALLDCEPVGDAMRWFKDEWLTYWHDRPKRLNIYVIVDSANAKKTKGTGSDYTTMWVVGLSPDKHAYVMDCVHDRLNLKERTEKLFDLHERWKPLATFWEQVGAMSDVQHVETEMDHKGYHFRIHQFDQLVAKEDRIRWLEPEFEGGRLHFPTRILRQCADGEMRNHVQEFIDQEYSVYPSVKHDDMLDDLANIKHPEVEAMMRYPETGTEAEGIAGGKAKSASYSKMKGPKK
jgi:predicted phage terminase large subunit-like protein